MDADHRVGHMSRNLGRTVDFSRYRHIWCFGCSFTRYLWPTWADLLAEHYPVTVTAGPGWGNYRIFRELWLKDQLGLIQPADLVMVCWTSVCREDRFFDQHWRGGGNIWSQNHYDDHFVKHHADPDHFLMRDCALTWSTSRALDGVCDHTHFSMAPMTLLDQYDSRHIARAENLPQWPDLFPAMHSNFYDVLWGGTVPQGRNDAHPTTAEHREFLDRVFPGWPGPGRE
jgi:hypothetical protein